MNKKDKADFTFETLFMFLDLKVIFLIVMLCLFYKETVLLADVLGNKKMEARILLSVWERAGQGLWVWVVAVVFGDIFIKQFLRKLHE